MKPTADLIDEFSSQLSSCELQFRLFGRRRRFFGPISTVRCHEDNVLVRQRLSEAGEGRVLVIDGGGSLATALVGDRLAELGRSNGWAGLVVNGAIRDTVAIDQLDFAVKALGTNPRKSRKTGLGDLDVTVTFGSAVFAAGNWLYSDEDGIVVSADRLPV